MHFTIVCYTFPPSKEIGGRRWAKFSQQLSRKGHEVTVICADNSVGKEWYLKEFPGINFRFLPKHYPEWLSGYTNTVREKLLYNIYSRGINPLMKHNLFDKGYRWRNPLLQELENVHKNQPIDVLVATGAPFSLLYYGAEFKMKHKEIWYVSDFRDPWTWGDYYGIPDLAPRKKQFQKMMELKTIQASNMVCSPTQNMEDVLKKIYPKYAPKLYLLPHAYDPEKFPEMTSEKKREGFIYGGSLYPGIEDYLISLDKVVKAHPDSGFRWDIFTGSQCSLIDSDFANGSVNKSGFISEEELFIRISNAAAYLAFFPETDKDLISTKFFEIIYLDTPILYIGEEGEVGRFIRENHLGVHILPENIEKELPKYLNGDVPYEKGYFDVSQYSFSIVTENFVEAIETKRSVKE